VMAKQRQPSAADDARGFLVSRRSIEEQMKNGQQTSVRREAKES
jgi:hypothetical protein